MIGFQYDEKMHKRGPKSITEIPFTKVSNKQKHTSGQNKRKGMFANHAKYNKLN